MLDAHLAVIDAHQPASSMRSSRSPPSRRADAARAAEAAVRRGEPLGPLHGLPVGIKDVTPTAGIRTTFGSPLYKDNVPDEDAEVVRRLKAAGAIVLGQDQHAGIRLPAPTPTTRCSAPPAIRGIRR